MKSSPFIVNGSLSNNVLYYLQLNSNSSSTIDFSNEFVRWDSPLIPSMRYDQVLKLSELFQIKTSKIAITLGAVNTIQGSTFPTDLLSLLCVTSDANCSSPIVVYFTAVDDKGYLSYSGNALFKGQVTIRNNSEYFNYYLTAAVQFSFQAVISCDHNSSNIFCNGFCSCINTQTCNNCYETFTTNCFSNVENFNQNCFNFFQNYMNLIGPNQQLDQLFYNHCTNKYKTIEDAIQDPVCACHMSDEVYTNIVNHLKTKFKNVDKVFDQSKLRCVLPQCASSNFPYSTIGKTKCQGVRCLNIVEVEGNNINFNKITVNQSGDCINLISHQ